MRNRHRITDQYYKSQPLRPIFQQTQLEQGMWIELIPHKLKMVIVEPGTGPTPKVGEFIRLKQFVYLDNMVNIKQERATYTFGRKRLLPGLEYCLSLCRQSFKGRIYIDSQLAYGKKSIPGIPANSNLIIDVQINAITVQPLSTGQYDDQQFLTEIIAKAKDGDSSAKSGNYINAQRCYEYAFQRIQSTRCKEIKNYLYNQSKISYMINNGEKTQAEINKQILEVVEMYKIFDIIKIKAVEMALVNRDYYKVIMLTRQCMMESRLEQNERILAARSRAFVQVGEFQSAIKIMRHLHDKSPEQPTYEAELKRILDKQKENKKFTFNMTCQPVLALTIPNTRRKRKHKRKVQEYYQQDNYQGDADESMMRMEPPIQLGMHIGYQDLEYFD